MQWNARSAVSNKNSLVNFLNTNKVDIALISETWFKPTTIIKFSGFNIIRSDNLNGKNGVAILIRKNFSFKEIKFTRNFNADIGVCGAEILINQSYISFLSIYRPPHIIANTNDWINIFNQVSSSPCLIGGDFNAHNGLWGSPKNDSTGNQLLNAIDELGLVVLNNGNATRLERPYQQKSVVDVTFCSTNLTSHFSWDTVADTLGSDHFPIIMDFSCKIPPNKIIFPKSKWNLKKANWELYSQLINQSFINLPHFDNTNDKYDFLLECINSAASLSIPTYKPFKTRQRAPPPWWDSKCEEAVAERKQAVQRYKENSSNENYLLCKRISAQTKKILKEAAKSSWINWCSNLNKNTPSTSLWTQAKKMHRILINNNTSIEVAENHLWVNEFFDSIAPPSANNLTNLDIDYPVNGNHPLCRPFDYNELEEVLRIVENTSPGYDDIKYPMLKYLPYRAKIFLLGIFNEVLLSGSVINNFKSIIVIPILKPGKNPNQASSYRPISLLSCIQKTFERMIKLRLEWWLSVHNLLPPNQFGFKKGFGAMDAVSTIVVDIQNSFSRNNYLCALFLDVNRAYESVCLSILEEKMCESFLIPKQIAKCIIDLFSNRVIYIRNSKNQRIGPRLHNMGLPQGSVLSPLLFNLYTADIHNLTSLQVNIVQYADDFCILADHRKLDKAINTLQTTVAELKKWFINNGFELSQDKSVFSIFSRHNTPNMIDIHIGGYQFPYQSTVKYLGVILDKKLTWKPHIESVCAKVNKGINFLKLTTKTWWGADVKTGLIFYKAYIRSIIDYGCILYGSANKYLLNRLDIVQRKALRICLGAMNSTPNEPLHVEALEPPLTLRRELLSCKFILKHFYLNTDLLHKISKLNNLDLCNSFWIKKPSPPLCSAFRDCYDLADFDPLTIQEYNHFDIIIDTPIIIPSYSENPIMSSNILKSVLEQFDNSIHIYTDASKSDSGTGAAYFIPSLKVEETLKLNPRFSIFTAEAIAIYEALLYIQQANLQTSIILSDSLSVLKAIRNTKAFNLKVNPYIIKIKHNINKINLSGKKVNFLWVKAHIGIQHNEHVDMLAKKGISAGNEPNHKMSLTDTHAVIKQTSKLKWDYLWSQYCFTNPTRYTRIHPNIPRNFWHENFQVSRKHVTSIIRLKFGHACYPAHLHKIGIYSSPNCDHCDTVADLDHIFFGCMKYHDASSTLIKHIINDSNIMAPFNILSLLSTASRKVYTYIMEFINSTKIRL